METKPRRNRAPARQSPTPAKRELVKIAKFADELGVNERTIRRWIARGWLPGYRLPGGDLRVDMRDIDTVATLADPETVAV